MRRFYIAGKSANTWFQLPLNIRTQYKLELVQLYGPTCNKNNESGCGKHFPLDLLSVDHIIPLSMGGSVCDIHNMQLLCFKCHKRKSLKVDNKGLTFELTANLQGNSTKHPLNMENHTMVH
jgi:hypothetical protein